VCVRLCPALCDFMDCSLPGSSARGIFWQEYLSGMLFPLPGDLPDPRNQTCISCVSCVGWQILYHLYSFFQKRVGVVTCLVCVCACLCVLFEEAQPLLHTRRRPSAQNRPTWLALAQTRAAGASFPPRHSRGPLERGVKSPVKAKVLEF